MKKLVLFLCAGALITAQSCKKDDDNSSPSKQAMLKGTWTLSQFGGDANNNGVLDNNETAPASALFGGKLTFNENGTGTTVITISGMSDSQDFKWSLIDDNKIQEISDGDTTIVDIKELTSNRLVGLWNDSTPKTWYVLTK